MITQSIIIIVTAMAILMIRGEFDESSESDVDKQARYSYCYAVEQGTIEQTWLYKELCQ